MGKDEEEMLQIDLTFNLWLQFVVTLALLREG